MPIVTYECIVCGKQRTAPLRRFKQPREKYMCRPCRNKDPSWLENVKLGAQKRSQDPVWKENNKKATQASAKNPVYKENHKKIMQELAKDPTWLANQKVGKQKRESNPVSVKNRNDALKKAREDPKWLENQIIKNRKMANDPEWQRKNKLAAEKRSQDPNYIERVLIGATGQGFWYGHPKLNGRIFKSYCELWNRDLWNRIDAAWNFESTISGKTKEDNKGRDLDRHHVYWQEKACCEWDEDAQGYYAMINLGTKTNPNIIKHYIKGNPNKFVLLTVNEHSMIRGNKKLGTTKLTWIKFFEDLIETREQEGKKCYLSKEEYEKYKNNIMRS